MKTKIQELKCGGPSKKMKRNGKKFSTGGINKIDTSNIKIPSLSSQTDKTTLAGGPKVSDVNNLNPYDRAAGFVSDTIGNVLDEAKVTEIDSREDPSGAMKKNAGLDTGKSVLSGAAKGFGIAGPWGAVAGAVISGLGRAFGAAKRNAQQEEATRNWSDSWSAKTASGLDKVGYKDGGAKRTVYFPIEDRKYDKNLKINNDWIVQTEKSKNIDELDNSIIGQWNNQPLTMKQFLDFPEHVKNYYKPHHIYEFQKNKLGLPNNYQELNMKPSPGGTGSPMYIPASNAKNAGNNVAYIGEEKPVNKLTAGLAKGGSVEGPGTGKSDSIPMKAPEGSFIVPTENADQAEELGKSFLGWEKEEKAKRNNGGTDIKVSNGEVFFTPDEVRVLKYHGVNLDELAPKAENKIGMKEGGMHIKPENRGKETATEKRTGKSATELAHSKNPVTARRGNFARMAKRHWKPLAEGGSVTELKCGGLTKKMKEGGEVPGFKDGTKSSEWTHDKKSDLVINDKTKTAFDKSGAEYTFSQPMDENGNPTGEGQFVKLKSGSPYGIDIYHNATSQDDTETPSWLKNLPELAGTIQAAGGAYGLMQAGKMPDLTVSRTLTKLSGEVRKLAEFGYEPAVLNALNTEIENTRKNLSIGIENEGGSGLEKMAKLNTLLSTTIDKKAGLAFANAAEKSRKWADVLKVDTMKAGQEFDINKVKVDDWYRNQEVFAGLVSAGISNIVGARQLKSEQDTMRAIGNNNPNWSPAK